MQQQCCCNEATMTGPLTHRRSWPRWWRRMQVAARRANFFAFIEVFSGLAFLVMTLATWVALNNGGGKGELLPSNISATLLVRTLAPAMAIRVLLVRRMAVRRAAETIGGPGRMPRPLGVLLSLIFHISPSLPSKG